MTVPPLADVGIPAPVESAERLFVSCTDEDESCVEPAKVKVTEATTAFGIAAVLRPQTRHVAVPVPLVHESDLPVTPDPAAKVADVKSVGE